MNVVDFSDVSAWKWVELLIKRMNEEHVVFVKAEKSVGKKKKSKNEKNKKETRLFI